MSDEKLSILLRVQYRELPEGIIKEVERMENRISFLEDEASYDDAINSIVEGLTELQSALGLPEEYFESDVAAGACINDGLKRIAKCLDKFGFHFDEDELILTIRGVKNENDY